MGAKFRIESGDGTKLEAHVHKFSTAGRPDHAGLLSLTRPFINFNPEFHPFLNDANGVAMNQAVTFGGAGLRATVIHAGVNSGSGESGTIDGGPTTDKLIQSGQNFNTTVGPGALVHNTVQNTFALVTAVDSDTQLALDTDIMDVASEAYVVNDIWLEQQFKAHGILLTQASLLSPGPIIMMRLLLLLLQHIYGTWLTLLTLQARWIWMLIMPITTPSFLNLVWMEFWLETQLI